MKSALEAQLASINQTINSIEETKSPSPDIKRSRNKDDEQSRLLQAEDFTKKLAADRRARLKRQKDKWRLERERMLKSLVVEDAERHQIEEKLVERRRERIVR